MRYDEVRWGVTGCQLRESCPRDAELLFDRTPACLSCSDELLERWRVMDEHPLLELVDWNADADVVRPARHICESCGRWVELDGYHSCG